jgi:DinB superfamily
MIKSSTIHPVYFQRYINQVKENDLQDAFRNQMPALEAFLQTITEEFSIRKYAEGKWTIKEVMQHLIDAERVFTYRAMCFARKEQAILPSFDENSYSFNSNGNNRHWHGLIAEFVAVRKSTEFLYNSFTDEALNTVGNASDYTISVASIGFVIVGHVNHHVRIIQERYIGV